MRAARFNAVIPLIDKHVIVSVLAKQVEMISRKFDGLSTLVTPGAAAVSAKTVDITTNTSILNGFFCCSNFFLQKEQNLDLYENLAATLLPSVYNTDVVILSSLNRSIKIFAIE